MNEVEEDPTRTTFNQALTVFEKESLSMKVTKNIPKNSTQPISLIKESEDEESPTIGTNYVLPEIGIRGYQLQQNEKISNNSGADV